MTFNWCTNSENSTCSPRVFPCFLELLNLHTFAALACCNQTCSLYIPHYVWVSAACFWWVWKSVMLEMLFSPEVLVYTRKLVYSILSIEVLIVCVRALELPSLDYPLVLVYYWYHGDHPLRAYLQLLTRLLFLSYIHTGTIMRWWRQQWHFV